jgi:hypothetical protein
VIRSNDELLHGLQLRFDEVILLRTKLVLN